MLNYKITEAIILAGGLGTRIRSVVPDLPKVLAEVSGRPFIEYLLDLLIKNGINRVIIAAGYKNEMILEHFQNGYKGLELDFSIEEKSLGTGGAILNSLSKVKDSQKILILNGDSYVDFDIQNFNINSDLSICYVEVEDISRYGSLDVDNGYLKRFIEKGAKGKGFINAGIYILDKSIFVNYELGKSFSFEKDFIPDFLKHNNINVEKLSSSLFIDIGTPQDFKKAQTFFN